MLKETITYTDYNDVERTEDHFFNLTEAELMEMEMGLKGGLSNTIQTAIEAEDNPTLIKVFKDLVLRSYGVRSEDGRRFIKKPELTEEFSQTEAYSQIFMKLATDADAAAKFINGIVSAKMAAEIEKQKLVEKAKEQVAN